MTERAQSLLEEVLALPYEERFRLSNAVRDSLHPPGEDLSPEEHKNAWAGELHRRQAARDAGQMRTYTLQEVKSRVDSLLNRS